MALVVAVAFAPVVSNGFVNWDDSRNFLENVHFRGIGPAQFLWAWTTYWMGVYQPVAWLLFGAEYAACGLRPSGYHLTSLALHVVNAVVVYIVAVALLARGLPDPRRWDRCTLHGSAALAAALFAVHPLRVGVVAWVSAQGYLPSTLFALLAVLMYLHASGPGASPTSRARRLVAAWLLFAAGLLGHATPLCLPAVLVILDVYPLRRLGASGQWFGRAARPIWLEKVPFLLLSAVFLVIAFQAKGPNKVLTEPVGLASRLTQAGFAVSFYLEKTLIPVGLAAHYPMPARIDWSRAPFLPRILVFVAVSVGLVLARRRYPGLLAAWASFLVLLTPNLGLTQTGNYQIAGDRYTYLAALAGVVPLASLVGNCARSGRRSRTIVTLVGLVCILGLTTLTRRQCRTWRDSESLWRQALSAWPDDNAWAHNNLGQALKERGARHDAEAHFREAIRLDPNYSDAHANVGACLFRRGDLEGASAHYRAALRRDPDFAGAHVGLGYTLHGLGELGPAKAEFGRAIALDPDSADARTGIGLVFSREGQLGPAMAELGRAVRLAPGSADSRNGLGEVLAKRGRLDEAIAQFKAAVRIDPNFADARNNLGAALAGQGHYAAAAVQFRRAVAVAPGFALARSNLGAALARLGRVDEAAAQFSEALRVAPGLTLARRGLAELREQRGASAKP